MTNEILQWLAGIAASFAAGGGIMKLWEVRRQARSDTIGQWQTIVTDLRAQLAHRDAELSAAREEVLKAGGIVSGLRVRLTTATGRIKLFRQALDLSREATDPLLLQSEMRAQGYLRTCPDGNILHAGPNLMAILDYEDSELVGRNIAELIPERFRERHRVFMERARDLSISLDTKNILNLVFVTKWGQEQPVSVRFRRIEDKGRLIEFSAMVLERDADAEDGGSRSDMPAVQS